MILDKISYISVIAEILNDHTKFSNLDIRVGKENNYIANLEQRITSGLKPLKNEEIIDKATYKNIKPVGSKRVRKSAQGHQEYTTTFSSNFVNYCYAY